MERIVDIEDQVSIVINNDDKILDAGYDSDDSYTSNVPCNVFICNGMAKIGEGNMEHDIVMKSFLAGIGPQAKDTTIVSIHKNLSGGLAGKARLESFWIFARALAEKCGGNANLKYAWYGASKEELCAIVKHGFIRCHESSNGVSHGVGIYLSPAKFPIDSMEASVADENDVRHVLLCHVILGKMEVIPPGSKQCFPSSMEFNSGVDDITAPKRYIIWSPYMNSHIFPKYIISFKSPSFNGVQKHRENLLKPSSPWVSFPALLSILSRFVEPTKMDLISKYHADFRKNKMTRLQLIQKVRQIIGDDVLVAIIKSCRDKLLVGAPRSGRGVMVAATPTSATCRREPNINMASD